MAVTLDEYSPFDSGPGSNVTEGQWRKFMRNVMSGGDGVLRGIGNEMAVYADSTGMQVKVKTGECWVQGAWGNNATEKTLPIATAAVGQWRRDRVILRNDFVNNRIELDVLTGTPLVADPLIPSLTRNSSMYEASLAEVWVGPGVVTIDPSSVFSARWRDRSSPFARYVRDSGSQTVSNVTRTQVQFPTAVFEDGNVTASGTGNSVFTLNRSGIWMINASITWNTESANFGGGRKISIGDVGSGGVIAFASQCCPGPGAAMGIAIINSTSYTREFYAGQQIQITAFQNSTADKYIEGTDDNNVATKVSFTWLGY